MKPAKKALKLLIEALPKQVRFKVIRRLVKLDEKTIPKNLMIKIAETQEEFQQAYHILYDAYVECGYQKKNSNELRIIKYFALPTTTTIIAKIDDKVIGTMSLIRRGPMGIPLEKEFDIANIIGQGKSIVEISSLAIAKESRHQKGPIFLPLCFYIYNYIVNFMQSDYATIAVNPNVSDFYEGLLAFSLLEKRAVPKYDFANGAPAVGLIRKCSSWSDDMYTLFRDTPYHRNLHQLGSETNKEYYQWPDRTYAKAMDPKLTPALLNYFFNRLSNIFDDMTENEKLTLQSYYSSPEYKDIIPKNKIKEARSSNRFIVNTYAIFKSSKILKVIETSINGLKITGLPDEDHFRLTVRIAEAKYAQLLVTKVWEDLKSQTCGLKIEKSDFNWSEYIQYLNSDLVKN